MPLQQDAASNNWYDFSQPGANYAHALCRWGAGMAAASKALAALFERMAEYQLQATRDMACVSRDPSRLAQAYADYGSRMMQMQAEMQGSMERIQREADLLYENLRRSLDDAMAAPTASTLGSSSLSPAIKYGAAASEGVDGPGGWRFDPSQRLPAPDSRPPSPSMPHTPASSAFPPAAATSTAPASAPMWPSMPFLPAMPWLFPQGGAESVAPVPVNYDEVGLLNGDALQTYEPTDSDVAVSLADARAAEAMFPRPPPAPPTVYPASCDLPEVASSVSYRCDGYRRVARAKL
jgi:hypothetical protein